MSVNFCVRNYFSVGIAIQIFLKSFDVIKLKTKKKYFILYVFN
jgi:hypothetical protein